MSMCAWIDCWNSIELDHICRSSYSRLFLSLPLPMASPGIGARVPVISQSYRQVMHQYYHPTPSQFIASPLHSVLNQSRPCSDLRISHTERCDHLGWGGIHRGAACHGTNGQNETDMKSTVCSDLENEQLLCELHDQLRNIDPKALHRLNASSVIPVRPGETGESFGHADFQVQTVPLNPCD